MIRGDAAKWVVVFKDSSMPLACAGSKENCEKSIRIFGPGPESYPGTFRLVTVVVTC
jgi:hypothetical protein